MASVVGRTGVVTGAHIASDVALTATYARTRAPRAAVAETRGLNTDPTRRVMAFPPAITFGTNGSFTLFPTGSHAFLLSSTSGRTLTCTDNNATSWGSRIFRSRRGRVVDYTSTFKFTRPRIGTLTTPTATPWVYTVEVGHYGDAAWFYLRNGVGAASKVRFKIDGKYASLTPTSLPNLASGQYACQLIFTVGTATIVASTGVFTVTPPTGQTGHGLSVGDAVVLGTITSTTGVSADTTYYVRTVPSATTFTLSATNGGAALSLTTDGSTASVAPMRSRRIELELWGADFGMAACRHDGSFFTPPVRSELSIYAIGDSFLQGAGATEGVFAGGLAEFARVTSGVDDLILDPVGGTGYLRQAGGSNNFLDRLTLYSADAGDSDLILFVGSVNDNIYTAAQVQAQAAACYALYPTKKVAAVVMASMAPTPAGQAAVLAGVQAAMAAAPNGLGVLDLTNELTGTGLAGTPTGEGNSDVLRSSDGTHPSDEGHQYYGARIGAWLRETILPQL